MQQRVLVLAITACAVNLGYVDALSSNLPFDNDHFSRLTSYWGPRIPFGKLTLYRDLSSGKCAKELKQTDISEEQYESLSTADEDDIPYRYPEGLVKSKCYKLDEGASCYRISNRLSTPGEERAEDSGIDISGGQACFFEAYQSRNCRFSRPDEMAMEGLSQDYGAASKYDKRLHGQHLLHYGYDRPPVSVPLSVEGSLDAAKMGDGPQFLDASGFWSFRIICQGRGTALRS